MFSGSVSQRIRNPNQRIRPLRPASSSFVAVQSASRESRAAHSSHHHRHFLAGPVSAVFHSLCPRRLAVLLRGGHGDHGDCCWSLWVWKVSHDYGARQGSARRGAVGCRTVEPEPESGRPDHGHGRLPVGRSARRPARRGSRPLGPQVRPGLRPDGNHLRQRGESHPPRAVHLRSRVRPRRLPLARQTDRARVEKSAEGGSQKSEDHSNPKSPIPLSTFLRPHSHRRCHRPGHGVRRGSGQLRRHPVARLPGQGRVAAGRAAARTATQRSRLGENESAAVESARTGSSR